MYHSYNTIYKGVKKQDTPILWIKLDDLIICSTPAESLYINNENGVLHKRLCQKLITVVLLCKAIRESKGIYFFLSLDLLLNILIWTSWEMKERENWRKGNLWLYIQSHWIFRSSWRCQVLDKFKTRRLSNRQDSRGRACRDSNPQEKLHRDYSVYFRW